MMLGIISSQMNGASGEVVYEYSPSPYLIPEDLGGSSISQSSVTSHTFSNSGISTGEYLVFTFNVTSASSPTPPTGFTEHVSRSSGIDGTINHYVFGGFFSGQTLTFSWGGSVSFSAAYRRFSNIDSSSPVITVDNAPQDGSIGTTRDLVFENYIGVSSEVFVIPTFAATNITTTLLWLGNVSSDRSNGAGAWLGSGQGTGMTWHNSAENLGVTTPRRWRPNNAKVALGSSLILRKASGTRPVANFDVTSLTDYLSASSAGWAFAVLKDGVVINDGVGGVYNKTTSDAVTSSTLFAVQSVTKIVTEALTQKLITAGTLSLSTTVGSVLGGVYTVPASWQNVTVLELLLMTSGANADFNNFTGDVQTYLSAGTTNTGEQKKYDNGDIAILVKMIEQVTGSSYSSLASSLILDPLGMTSYSFDTNDSPVLYYQYGSTSTTSYDPPEVSIDGVSGLNLCLDDFKKLPLLFRTNKALTSSEIDQILERRGRMRQRFTGRDEVLGHDGVLFSSLMGGRAYFMRMSDGYDIVVMLNAYEDSSNFVTAILDTLTNTN